MISYKTETGKFNFRTAAIIYNKDKTKVLLQQSKNCKFSVLPGGRVEELESSYDAIKRELMEELGIHADGKLMIMAENFFHLFNMNYHELSYYYIITSINEQEIYLKQGKFLGCEQKDDYYWIDIEEFKNIEFEPKFLKPYIINQDTELKHLIVNELNESSNKVEI